MRRCPDRASKCPFITLGNMLAHFEPFLERLEADEQHCGLQRIEAASHAKAHGDVSRAASAVTADLAYRIGELVVIRKDRSSVAKTSERLGRIEAGGRRRRERAHSAPALHATEALGSVGNDRQPVRLGDRLDGGVVCRKTIKVDRNDGLWLQRAAAENCTDHPLERFGGNVQGYWIDIGEDRNGTRGDDSTGCCGERESRNEHRIPGADARCHECHGQGIASARHANGVADAGVARKSGFEFLNLRPEDESAVLQDIRNASGETGTEPLSLVRQVE